MCVCVTYTALLISWLEKLPPQRTSDISSTCVWLKKEERRKKKEERRRRNTAIKEGTRNTHKELTSTKDTEREKRSSTNEQKGRKAKSVSMNEFQKGGTKPPKHTYIQACIPG